MQMFYYVYVTRICDFTNIVLMKGIYICKVSHLNNDAYPDCIIITLTYTTRVAYHYGFSVIITEIDLRLR